MKIGDKVLITTTNWFVAPDGDSYQSVFGTVKAILDSEKALGVRTNSKSSNWYVEIGCMIVAGCQIHYAIKTDSVNEDSITVRCPEKEKDVTKDSVIFNADEGHAEKSWKWPPWQTESVKNGLSGVGKSALASFSKKPTL